jgi:hypothetical protein
VGKKIYISNNMILLKKRRPFQTAFMRDRGFIILEKKYPEEKKFKIYYAVKKIRGTPVGTPYFFFTSGSSLLSIQYQMYIFLRIFWLKFKSAP